MPWDTNLHEYVHDAMELVHQTYEGTASLGAMPRLVEVLHRVESPEIKDSAHRARDVAHAAKGAEYAAKAKTSGFALLHAHTVMGLWGALEAAVEDLALEWLEKDPTLLSRRQKFMKIKVPVSVYETLTPSARFKMIIGELQRDLGNDQSFGIGQFEKILAEVELTGAVHPRPRRLLLLAQQYRHLVAHRGGRADARFINACPDSGYVEGDLVSLSAKQMNDIFMAVIAYKEALENRVRAALGVPAHDSDGLAEWLADEW